MKVVLESLLFAFLFNSVWLGETLLSPAYLGALEVNEKQQQIAGNREFGGYTEQWKSP